MRSALTAGLIGLTAFAVNAGDEFPKAARDKGIAATVQVSNDADGKSGSGVVIRIDGKVAYALTAAHVVPKAKTVDVVVPGKTLKAEVLARSDKSDLAVLRLSADGMPPAIPVAPLKTEPKAVVSVGWEKGDAPTASDETARGKVRLKRPGESEAVLCWEMARKQATGRSGGPLIDGTGRVVGLASGHDGEFGYYVHADEIHAFLRANGLKYVLEEDR